MRWTTKCHENRPGVASIQPRSSITCLFDICALLRVVKPTDRQLGPCSTSSLESCGVLSGPVASSGQSQFPSPSHVLASSRQEPFSTQHGTVPSPSPSGHAARAFSSAHDDVGYMRIPVANQVNVFLSTIVTEAVLGDHAHHAIDPARSSTSLSLYTFNHSMLSPQL